MRKEDCDVAPLSRRAAIREQLVEPRHGSAPECHMSSIHWPRSEASRSIRPDLVGARIGDLAGVGPIAPFDGHHHGVAGVW